MNKQTSTLVASVAMLVVAALAYAGGPCNTPRLSSQHNGSSTATCEHEWTFLVGWYWVPDTCTDDSTVTPGGCFDPATSKQCLSETDHFTHHSWNPKAAQYSDGLESLCEAQGCEDDPYDDTTTNAYASSLGCGG